jgi:integrase/recombinase XerD
MACAYLGAGGDVYKLSRLLGHTSVSVTEHYLRAFSARAARQGVSVFDTLAKLA